MYKIRSHYIFSLEKYFNADLGKNQLCVIFNQGLLKQEQLILLGIQL